MAQSRSEIFAAMAQAQPDNEMVWYGLANEYVKEERWADAAQALRRVLDLKPDYTAAYQILGTALMNQGEPEAARQVWTEGVAVARRTGAWKAQQHIQGLLANMTTLSDDGFCE